MTRSSRLLRLAVLAFVLSVWSGAESIAGTYGIILAGNDTTQFTWESPRGLLQGAFDRATERTADAFLGELSLDGLLRLRADALTEVGFEAQVRDFVSMTGPNDALLFYYAGHGLVGSMQPAFVSPSDGIEEEDATETPRGLYAYDRLWSLLGSRACRTVVIIDACFSGSAIGEFDDSWTVVTSCRADQRTLLAWNYGSVFNVWFIHAITSGRTRLDEILEGVYLQFGEEFQVAGDAGVDLAAPCL